ncbi:MAG: septation ring formation regulator EzrA [Bacilli bacterium]|jgi:septation ring formation regulator EzrA|nr:septation ring formation regulator EzrA [Bacilli bacterium]
MKTMAVVVLLDLNGIIAISVAGGLLVLGIFIFLYFAVFMHLRLKRQVRDLNARFERSHGLLFGQDSQFVKRLENISSMNLTYVQEYMDWNKKFKDIRDVSDASAQASINGTKDMLAARRYKDLRAQLPLARKAVDDYEAQVASLDKALRHMFQDEEDCRARSFDEREKLRKIKQEYFARQADLSLVGPSFESVFTKLDSLFDQVEQDIENAQYIDAKALLINRISPVGDSLAATLRALPNVCVSIQSVLPDKIASLQNRYDEMIKDGYPLYHILLPDDFAALKDELASLAKRVQDFDMRGVEKELDDMAHHLEGYGAKFDSEKAARTVFQAECDGVYAKENDLEKNFIVLCNALPAVRKIYQMSGEEARIDAIQSAINKAGASRRNLDSVIHTATKQPYSLLVERMRSLKAQDEEATKQIADFQSYLVSLKTDSEKANAALSVYWSRLKGAEKTLRDLNVKPIYDRYESRIDDLYATLDGLSDDLRSMPIDVKKVDADLIALESGADAFVESVAKDRGEADDAEKAIVFANRFRGDSGELNALMIQCEGLFYSGDFTKAKAAAEEAVSHIQEGR